MEAGSCRHCSGSAPSGCSADTASSGMHAACESFPNDLSGVSKLVGSPADYFLHSVNISTQLMVNPLKFVNKIEKCLN